MSYQPPPPPPGAVPPPPPGQPPEPPQFAPPGPPTAEQPYPLRFDVEYPDRDLDRLSTGLRLLWIIPIAIVLSAFDPPTYAYVDGEMYSTGMTFGGLLVFPTLMMILFRQKYPRWWFDFNRNLTAFTSRVESYAMLMSDKYPSTDEEQYVRLEIDYPDAQNDLNRWLPLVKWFLAIPHYIVLFFLGIGAFFALIFVWFAILFTGRYPRDVFGFLVGVLRWGNRVGAYAFLLVTDRYPPFRLGP